MPGPECKSPDTLWAPLSSPDGMSPCLFPLGGLKRRDPAQAPWRPPSFSTAASFLYPNSPMWPREGKHSPHTPLVQSATASVSWKEDFIELRAGPSSSLPPFFSSLERPSALMEERSTVLETHSVETLSTWEPGSLGPDILTMLSAARCVFADCACVIVFMHSL